MHGPAYPNFSATQGRTVSAVVVRVVTARGFGFAELIGEHDGQGGPAVTFFNASTCRTTVRHPGGAVEYTDPANKTVSVGSRIITKVRRGDQGLYAVAWGISPAFDWRAELAERAETYVGGIARSVRARGTMFPGREVDGTLRTVQLTPERLTLVLDNLWARGADGHMRRTPENGASFSYVLDRRAVPVWVRHDFGILIPEKYQGRTYERLIAFDPPPVNS